MRVTSDANAKASQTRLQGTKQAINLIIKVIQMREQMHGRLHTQECFPSNEFPYSQDATTSWRFTTLWHAQNDVNDEDEKSRAFHKL